VDTRRERKNGGLSEDLQSGYEGKPSDVGLDNDKWNKYSNDELAAKMRMLKVGAIGGIFSNKWSIANAIFERFLSGNGTDYSSQELNKEIAKNSDFKKFKEDFHKVFHQRLDNPDGINGVLKNPIKISGPVFGSNFNGLGIILHSINYTSITLDSYSEPYGNGFYSADFTVHLEDAFGLDRDDLLKQGYGHKWYGGASGTNDGFNSWWLLQHSRGYNAFKIKVDIKIHLEGNLNENIDY